MTPLAAFSLATSTVLVDTSRRSTSYEARLLKYVRRGFRLVYPSLKYTDAGFKVSKLTFRPSSDKERQSNFPSSHRSTQYELPPEEKDEAKNDYGSDEHPSVFAYSNIIKVRGSLFGRNFSSHLTFSSLGSKCRCWGNHFLRHVGGIESRRASRQSDRSRWRWAGAPLSSARAQQF